MAEPQGSTCNYPDRASYRAAWNKAGEVTPPIPLNVDIELASLCDLKCPFCFWSSDNHQLQIRQKAQDGKPKARFMREVDAIRLIDECAELGVPALKFNSRGESTLHPEYSRILQYAESKGCFHDRLVNTHGNVSDSVIPGLMSATKVMISLDSLVPETYAKMRRGGNLGTVCQVIDILRERHHPNLWVRRVVTKENVNEDFISMAKERWPGINASEHACFDRNEANAFGASASDQRIVTTQDPFASGVAIQAFAQPWGRRYCEQPSQRLTVTSEGAVIPCCVDWNTELIVGRWPEQSLKEIWNGATIETLRSELKAGKFRAAICRDCPSFSSWDRPEREWLKDLEGQRVRA